VHREALPAIGIDPLAVDVALFAEQLRIFKRKAYDISGSVHAGTSKSEILRRDNSGTEPKLAAANHSMRMFAALMIAP
jgi:hypothetical protein